MRWMPSPASSNVTSPTKSSSPPHGHGSADGSNHGCAARNSSAPGRAAVADVGAMRGSGGGWQKPNFSQVTEIYFVAKTENVLLGTRFQPCSEGRCLGCKRRDKLSLALVAAQVLLASEHRALELRLNPLSRPNLAGSHGDVGRQCCAPAHGAHGREPRRGCGWRAPVPRDAQPW